MDHCAIPSMSVAMNNFLTTTMFTQKPIRRCMFQALGNCRDLVSRYCCNEHAHRFALHYSEYNSVDLNNTARTGVHAYIYIYGQSAFSLSYFLTEDGAHNLEEVSNFVDNAYQNYPGGRADEEREALKSLISCYIGVRGYGLNCPVGNWMDDASSYLMTRQKDGTYHPMATSQQSTRAI